uniref:candidapepsin n=1 Tax=Ogataea minuta TaxID=36026 RepID=Q25C39_9ASCO|nr:Yapsin1 [Ogataea minuta]
MRCKNILEAMLLVAGGTVPVAGLPAGESKANSSPGYLRMEAEIYRGHSFETSQRGGRPYMLEKRAEDGSVLMELQNNQSFYKVELEVGSDKQKIGVLVDTGSSDLWIMNQNNSYCESSSSSSKMRERKGRKLSDLRNLNLDVSEKNVKAVGAAETETMTLSVGEGLFSWFETQTDGSGGETETASGDSSEATIDCSVYGTFDPSSSDTFKSNGTEFSISYADDSFAKGTWGTDDVTFNGVTVDQLSMAIADETNSSMGVLGIGLKGLETTYSGDVTNAYTYENLPYKMQSQGLISKPVYSVYLNDSESSAASILFGAVDHDKYTGTLTLLPIINTAESLGYSTPVRLEVTLSKLYTGSSSNKTAVSIASGAAAALLDTGTTLTYVPSDIISTIVDQYGFQYSSSVGTYVAKCDSLDDAEIVFDFQGTKIWVPFSSFAVSLTTNGGSQSSYCALGLMDSGDDTFTLGDSFLNNVYFVADLENLQIAIAPANLDSTSEDIEVVSDSGIPSAKSASAYSSSWGASGSAVASSLSVQTGAETVTSTDAGSDSTGSASGSSGSASSSSSKSSASSSSGSSGSSSKSGSSSSKYAAGNAWGMSVCSLAFTIAVSVLVIG